MGLIKNSDRIYSFKNKWFWPIKNHALNKFIIKNPTNSCDYDIKELYGGTYSINYMIIYNY